MKVDANMFGSIPGRTAQEALVTLQSLEVTSIGRSAFSKCVNLREVNLLDSSIEVIDEFAFKNCESLRPTIVKLSEFCLDTTMLEHP